MDKTNIFIELLKLEAKKAKAISEMKDATSNDLIKAQGVRANVILECIDWANLLLRDEKQPEK